MCQNDVPIMSRGTEKLRTSKHYEIPDESKKEKEPIDYRTFLLGLGAWSVLYILIPVIIYAIIRDWTVALSLTGKIGIGLIVLGFLLLGISGASRVPTTGGTALVSVKDISRPETREVKKRDQVNIWEILNLGKVLTLFWGIIYVLPFAFGIPFLL